MKALISGLAFFMLLGGCAEAPDLRTAPVLGHLVLKETLVIPPEAASVRLQYGRTVPFNGVQHHDPFCVFEIDTVSPDPQTVHAGSFAIVRISHSVDPFAAASAPRIVRVSKDDGGGPAHLYYKTHFRLRHDTQAVRALTCMSDQLAPGVFPFMRHLTPAEIRQALGGLFTLEYPT